jgi:hypothetical protein
VRRTEASNNSPPSYLLAASKMQLSSSQIIDGMLFFRGRGFFRKKSSLGIGSDAEILFDETKILVLLNLHISNFHFVNDCNACKE